MIMSIITNDISIVEKSSIASKTAVFLRFSKVVRNLSPIGSAYFMKHSVKVFDFIESSLYFFTTR